VTYFEAGIQLIAVVDPQTPAGKKVGALALIPAGGLEFIVGFGIEEATNSWAVWLQTLDVNFTLKNYTRISASNTLRVNDLQLTPASTSPLNTHHGHHSNSLQVSGHFFVTVQFTNTSHTVIRRLYIRQVDIYVTDLLDVVAYFNSNAFVSGVNILPSGEVVTVWLNNADNNYIYGHSKDYRPGYPDPITFKIPAATATSEIKTLIVNPMSEATFAVTQVVRGTNPSAFVNYYVLSNCGDAQITPNENCIAGNEGCVNCMCSQETGWHSTGDGQTCMTCKCLYIINLQYAYSF